MAAVASVQLSATTTIRYRALGQLSPCKLEIVLPIPAASSCAGTTTSKNISREDAGGDAGRADRHVNTRRYMQAAVAGNATIDRAMRTMMEYARCISVSVSEAVDDRSDD